MNEWLVVTAIASAALSGVPGLFFQRTSKAGEKIATALLLLAATGASLGAFRALFFSASPPLLKPWHVPGGEFAISIDGLSAMFLLQIFIIGAAGSVYGLGYWSQDQHLNNGRKLRLFYGVLTAAMGLIVIARNSLLFLVGWEVMALSAFLVVTTEDEKPDVRRVGYVFLIATRLSALCLFAMFAVLISATGTFDFGPKVSVSSGAATAIFVLGLLGCGLKAGMMPLHVWLPGAHASAPSHVSSFMSGVMIKMGVYGLMRICAGFEHPPIWWGVAILGFGALSGILGVAFAIGQHDLKRLLAYHSIENIGIIYLGLGLAVIGQGADRPELVVLGLGGALLHVWNHGLFKALLFFSAGSVIHATHSREIDRFGGLLKKMPSTGIYFLIGSVAICGLPPLNGFVSEFLVYLGLFRSLSERQGNWWLTTAFTIPALALIGALALACFTKVFGVVFLGQSRSPSLGQARESGKLMLGPMAFLAGCCILIGVGPTLVAPVLNSALSAWTQGKAHPNLLTLAPLKALSLSAFALISAILVVGWFLQRRVRAGQPATGLTWDCGYAAPRSTMQYTSSSFAQMLVHLFAFALKPKIGAPVIQGPFPKRSDFVSDVPEPVLDRFLVPLTETVARGFTALRWIQRGNVQLYLAYVLATLVVLLIFS